MNNITYYNNAFGQESVEVNLNDILKAIKSGKWIDKVEKYRKLSENGKNEESDKYKRTQLPGITASGTFPNNRKASELENHSGFIAMDFDDVDDVETFASEIYADDYTYCGFKSVSGRGLCILVKIDASKHLEAFKGLEHYYFTKYDKQIDQSCKDVSRLRFVSYDKELFINPESKKFENYIKSKKGRKPKIKNIASTDDDIDLVIKQVQANRLDLTQNYDDWIQLGLSIASKYGQSEKGSSLFHAISQYHPEYDYEKTEKKYKSFGTPSKISISTLFYYAKQTGLEIKSKETKTIETVALYAKKGRRKPEDAIKQLEKVDNIPQEKSKDIVRAVFDGEIEPSQDDDIIFEIEQFLKRECDIRYNDVTLKYEQNGKPMTDRDFNSSYLDCKKVIPKVTKDLFMSCIDSDRTPVYSPIKLFFEENKHRKKTGLIKKLAKSINTTTGYSSEGDFPEYAEYFIRKWMIGAVAMWHGKHSPLMLVLAGSKQNTGKSHFFRYLFPDSMQMYYAEAELTGDKDENLLMCTKALIMNDEMSNKSKRDITVLKKLCSTKWFNLRKPYGKMSEDFRRIAALAGTSNSMELLNDPSGNRRIIPIEVLSIDHDQYNEVNKTDLWVEAYKAFRDGESFELTNDDIKTLSRCTMGFEEASLEGELLTRFFEPGFESKMTNSEIKYYIETRTQQKLNQRKLGMEMKKHGFEKKTYKVNGVSKQLYGVNELRMRKDTGDMLLPGDDDDDAPF